MPFEEYSLKRARTRFGFPAVTIMRSGGLSFNDKANDEIGKPERVVLAYDNERQLIGIRAARDGDEVTFPVRRASNDSWWVPARSFLKYFDIARDKTTKFRAQTHDEGYLAVSLRSRPVHEERRAASGREAADDDIRKT